MSKPERAAVGSTPGPSTSGVHAIAHAGATGPLGRPHRNGHATVVGRLVELALTAASEGERARSVNLSLEDELQLKDGDERQLGAIGLAIARSGSVLEWRAALTTYFRRRYGLAVLFDAKSTTIA
jgi:hypothetical protein